MSPPRTLLFAPAHRPQRFARALAACPHGIVLDLEDGVGAADKTAARRWALEWLATPEAMDAAPLLCLRINEPATEAGLEDLYALRHAPALPARGWLVLPKLEDPALLAFVAAHLHRRAPGWRLCGLIETAAGLRAVGTLARAHDALVALGFGAADLRAQLGAAQGWEPLLHARSRLVLETAGSGLTLYDVPHLALDDDDGLRDEARRARALGFHGKFSIHPRQVPVVIEAFAPTPDEIDAARRVVARFEASGGHACEVDGRMVDEPVYRHARALLSRLETS